MRWSERIAGEFLGVVGKPQRRLMLAGQKLETPDRPDAGHGIEMEAGDDGLIEVLPRIGGVAAEEEAAPAGAREQDRAMPSAVTRRLQHLDPRQHLGVGFDQLDLRAFGEEPLVGVRQGLERLRPPGLPQLLDVNEDRRPG